MTNQLVGEILFQGIDGSNDEWIYTPWMSVRGDIATFAVEVLARVGVTLSWNVETRTAEDPGTIGDLLASPRTTTGNDNFTSSSTEPVKQLVRYKFATGGTASTTNYIMIRALSPSWQSNR